MKIFFTDTVHIVKYGLGQAFADLGHEVRFVNVVFDDNWKEKLEDFQPDYVLSVGGWGIRDKLFPYLHHRKIPHIYWAIEDPPYFHALSLPFARESAYVFTTCKEALSLYRNYGIRAKWVLFACHPEFNRIVPPDSRFNHDIAFVGNNYEEYPERVEASRQTIGTLIERGYNIKVYGNEWWMRGDYPFHIDPKFYGGYLAIEDLPALCASVPIILGLHSVVSSKTMMSMRTFEVLGNGGFHLTQWTPAIENLFKNHHHLVWTRSADETQRIVDYYLARPEERRQIALQGQAEVYAWHTYHHRVQDILKVIADGNRQPIISPLAKKSPQIVVKDIVQVQVTTERLDTTKIYAPKKYNIHMLNYRKSKKSKR
ncbi:MAG: glycosyltransferase [Syntrophomonadaceae bacterium]|nr:glycosyltransferase [Syntrophomonadaceae bacterium]MDD3889300.1 glycosyltransferase [Syntrophomonadaceae bacterium]MDD4549861.1 glycosyltransferase [Syntrophomonadaceae bacterium]